MLGSADAVRDFYESHPYPAPLRDLERHRALYRNPDRRRSLSLMLWPTEHQRPDRKILVAGCGTSQAAAYALREPDARVTAIDISETSLRHTLDLQQNMVCETSTSIGWRSKRSASSAGHLIRSSAPACCTTCLTRIWVCGYCAMSLIAMARCS